MSLLPKNPHGCPFLFLAPMEGVGDRCFRKAMASIGGFDEGVTDFLRVPKNAHVESLAREYDPKEIDPIPLAAQIMGSDTDLMPAMALELEKKGAPRIDLNCGCPSNTVTGRGAGSSLLRTPELLYEVAKAMVKAVRLPVSIKMRSGYEDISLFKENLLAAQESGVKFITLHPRTKVDGYGPPAKWELIAEAKSILKIPVIGNGDILNVNDAVRMLGQTKCDALMIGRGAVINPFIFHQIKAYFANVPYEIEWQKIRKYIDVYLAAIPDETPLRIRINKLKQLFGFLFKGNDCLLSYREGILRQTPSSVGEFIDHTLPLLQKGMNLDRPDMKL